MTEYKVIWEVDIDANSPLEAVKLAREIQTDSSNIANVFTIKNSQTLEVLTIDDEGNGYNNPNWIVNGLKFSK